VDGNSGPAQPEMVHEIMDLPGNQIEQTSHHRCWILRATWETFRSSVYWMGAYIVDSIPAMLNVFSNDYIVNSIYPIIATLRERDSPVALVQDTRHSFCSDPKDRIYGLLSILPLKMRQGIHVNYDNTQEEVYQAFAREHIRYSQSLDILAACEFRESPNLPTWVPDFSLPKRPMAFDRAFGCLRRTKYFASPTDTELPIFGRTCRHY
jgi:hypothetical protein